MFPNLKHFESTINGQATQAWLLESSQGGKAVITNYGARIVSWGIPDRQSSDAHWVDVVQGFGSIDQYVNAPTPYHGCIVGPVANRLSSGNVDILGLSYVLPPSQQYWLHSGDQGLHQQVWEYQGGNANTLQLSVTTLDMTTKSPLTVQITYSLSDDNELILLYEAFCEASTMLNLTAHPFFNLAGEAQPSILDHELQIFASQITPIDANLLPSGAFLSVENTPFDFRQPKRIGDQIALSHPQLTLAQGFDHYYQFDKPKNTLAVVAQVREPVSGRTLTVMTTEPGLQFYSGNFSNGQDIGKSGVAYGYRSAFCLETQHPNDAIHHANFDSVVLPKGEHYRSETRYRLHY